MPPIKAFTVTRRNLPHWQQPGSTYFLTWRALTLMLEPDDRIITLNAILFWDARRWDVYAAVVMPDHVHVLVRPRPISPSSPEVFHSLSAILHSVKGFTSHRINNRLNRSGCVWQDETYDRISAAMRKNSSRSGTTSARTRSRLGWSPHPRNTRGTMRRSIP